MRVDAMFNWIVIIVAWIAGAAYVAGLATAMLVVYLFPMPGRRLDNCWKKLKEIK